MASIPTVDYPAGMTPPTPSAGGSSGMPALPALPALSSYTTGDTSNSVGMGASGGGTVNGMTGSQIADNQATGGTGNPAVSPASGNIWQQFGAWLKSIALSGTFALVALLLIILSVYIAVTRHGGVVLPSK